MALLERARAGESGVLVLRGDPGIGKTALLDAAVGQATERRMGVLRARGVESEAELAFAGLAELLGPVIELREQIPALQAASVASALGIGDLVPYARFPVLAGTLSLLAAAAERGPLLVVVDDAQWLDAPSAEALMFVARRLRFEGIALLVALRPGDGNGFAATGMEALDLSGLDSSASRELVGERRGVAVSDAVARELRDATGGNPLALQTAAELLDGEQLRGGRPLPRPLAVGAQIAEAFLARVARLPEASVLALTAAAAGGTADIAQLAEALGVLDLETSDLQPAEDAGLIDLGGSVLEFQHPLLRSALYQAATPGRRREIHAALAESLDADDERCAWHLAAAAAGPEERLAATVEQAARGASKRGGHMTAARLLERAADLSPDHEARARRLLRAANDAHRGGRPGWAIQRVERALELVREPRLRAEIVHMRGSLEQYAGSTARARELLVGEAETIRAADPRLATLILLDAAATSVLAGDLLTAHATAKAATEVAAGVEGIVGQMPAALERMLAMTRGEPPPPERLGMLLEELLSTRALPPGAMWLAQFAVSDLVFSEVYEAARGGLERMIGALRAFSAFGLLPLPLLTQAELDFRTGRWISAYGAALEAVEIASEADELSLASMALAGAARIEAATGRRESCVTHAVEAERIARAVGARSASMIASSALGLAALGEGRSEDAIGHLMPIAEQVTGAGIEHPAVIQWAPDLVEAYVRTGNTVAAERELEDPAGARAALAAYVGAGRERALSWSARRIGGLRAELRRSHALARPYGDTVRGGADASLPRRAPTPRGASCRRARTAGSGACDLHAARRRAVEPARARRAWRYDPGAARRWRSHCGTAADLAGAARSERDRRWRDQPRGGGGAVPESEDRQRTPGKHLSQARHQASQSACAHLRTAGRAGRARRRA